jgi:hypothetical protein
MTGLSAVRCRCSHVRLTKQHELLSPLTDHPGDGPASISDRIAPCNCRRLSRGMAGTPYRSYATYKPDVIPLVAARCAAIQPLISAIIVRVHPIESAARTA